MTYMTVGGMFGQATAWKTHWCSDVNAKTAKKGSIAKVAGWIHFFRDKGKIIFVHLRDASGMCQILFKDGETPPEVFAEVKRLGYESVITVEGHVIAEERAINGAELHPTSLTIHSIAAPKLPLDINAKVKFDIDTEFRFRELSIRTPRVQAVMKVKAEVAASVRSFFKDHGFTEIFTPYILATATEGGAMKFQLDYFGTPAVLAQSCQFYKQAAIQVHEKVFGIIPSWRAEKSRTPKHVTEFHQIENEIAFGTHETIMEVQENLVHSVVTHVLSACKSQLELLERKDLVVPKLPFRRMTFYEAKDILEQELDVHDPRDDDFTAPAESALSRHIGAPFFITKIPTALRGIYYETDPENEFLTNSLDLIAPEGHGELSSGGERVSSKERLITRITNAGMNPEGFEWYLRMFEYGFPPHAGYGLGFERLVRWICGLESIREAFMFPRTPDLVQP